MLARRTIKIRSVARKGPAAKSASARIALVKKILREVPLIDGHNDLPWQFRKRGNDLDAINLAGDTRRLRPPLVTDIPRLRAGSVGGQFWAVYVPPMLTGTDFVRAVLEQFDITHRMVARYSKTFELALTAADVKRIHAQGKIASLIGMEGGHVIDNSLAVLRMTYLLGARYMTLTHVKNVDWADSANDKPRCRGLSAFGEQVIREMNRLGMLADLSHVSAETMRATLKITRAPVIFSHSCARALCDNSRNVPDDVLKRMPANGGLVMVTFLSQYLIEPARIRSLKRSREKARLEKSFPRHAKKVQAGLDAWEKANPAPRASLSDVADHIDHVRKIAGINHVGIGGDYEGFDGPPAGLEDVSCYPALLAELMRRGYSIDDIKKVAGLNILRVIAQAEGVAAKLQKNPRLKS